MRSLGNHDAKWSGFQLIECSPNLLGVYIRLCKHGNHFTFLQYISHLLQEIKFSLQGLIIVLILLKKLLETLVKSKILKFTLEKSTEESSSSPICINSLYAYEITPKGRSSQWPIKVTVGACHSNL